MPKKKTALTIEERLQQALVPAEEQPYDVPENWVWVRLGEVNKYISKSVNPISEPDKIFELYSVPSMTDDYPEIIEGSNIGSSKQSVCKEDVLLCKINPRINRVWKVSQFTDNELIASSEWIIIRNNNINADYLMYCFQSKYFREFMLSNVSGVGGSLMRAQPKYVQKYPIPLPPRSEQQRIVERIEELFAKLDEAKERLQEVVDSFAVRKAAILHKAFTGELTKQWRRENGVSDESWEDVSLGSVCKSIYDGDHMPPPKSEKGIPFLVISNVNTGAISFEKCRFVPEEYFNNLSETRTPEKGDILYTIVGSYGIPVMVDTEQKFCFQRHMALLKPRSIYNRFLWCQLQTQSFFEQATSIATGTAQLTVPIKGLRKLLIKCPTLPEQHEIVRLIDDLLARERSAQQAAEQALASIELMKKSILARAFRGELGTNKASEASAVELLKQVLAEN